MQRAARGKIVCQVSGKSGDFRQRAHEHFLFAPRLQVRPQERKQRNRRQDAGKQQQRQNGPKARSPPVGWPRRRRRHQGDGGEDEKIHRREGLQDVPDGKPHRIFHSRRVEQTIQREQCNREKFQVQQLNVRKVREREAVECRERAARDTGQPASRPSLDDNGSRPAGEGQSREQHQVVDENRRAARPAHRRADHRLYEQMLGKCERVPLGIEDVGVEQMHGVAHDLVRHPRERPGVQLSVGLAVAAETAGSRRQRPRVHDRKQHEQREHGRRRAPRSSRGRRTVTCHYRLACTASSSDRVSGRRGNRRRA